VVALAATGIEVAISHIIAWVQASEALSLAAGRGGNTIRELATGEFAALLVAFTQELLLVLKTSAWQVWAGCARITMIRTAHIKAFARNEADCRHLEHVTLAIMFLAARECATSNSLWILR
jgi:hypothetical protein